MTATPKRRRGWASSQPAAINWQHPIAQGLGGFAVSNYVLTQQPAVAASGAGAVVPSPYGLAWNSQPASGLSMCAFPAQDDTTCFTLLAVAKTVTLNNDGTQVGYRGSTLNFAKLNGVGATGAPQLNYFSSGSNRSLADTTGGSGGWEVTAATKSALTLSVYRGGGRVNQAFWASGQLTIASAGTCYYGVDAAGDHAAQIAMGAFWPTRALSDAEIAELSVDPFAFVTQLPRRRRVIV